MNNNNNNDNNNNNNNEIKELIEGHEKIFQKDEL